MTDITTALVNEIQTLHDYRLACLLVQHRIQAGHEVEWTVLHSLAVKGHVIALETGEPVLVAQQFLATHRAEPGILEDNVSDDRG